MRIALVRLELAGLAALCGCPGGALQPLDTDTDASGGDVPRWDGPPAVFKAVNGCLQDQYVDRHAGPDARRTVLFGVGAGYTFDPPCVIISPGQSVRFSGIFATHNLMPGTAPDRTGDPVGDEPNPFRPTTSGSEATFTYLRPGIYPYYCNQHYNVSMYGSVWVR